MVTNFSSFSGYSSIYTVYVESVVYTVDSGTGSTIGSSIKHSPNATATIETNFTVFADWGAVQYTTLNTLADADQRATLVQINSISMNGSKNGYLMSTQYIDTAETGPARTKCNNSGSFFGYFGGPETNAGLPEFTDYSFTTVFPFGASSGNVAAALTYGLDTLASEVATYLHLTVPNCQSAGGGSGTLKVGVTALTSVSTTFVTAAQVISTPPPKSIPPPPDTTKAQPSPSPSPTPPSPPVPTTPNSPLKETTVAPELPVPGATTGLSAAAQTTVPSPDNPSRPEASSVVVIASANPAKSSGSPNGGEATTIVPIASEPPSSQLISQVATQDLSSFGEIKTLVQTITGPSGVQTISAVASLEVAESGSKSGSYVTTLVQTTAGPAGAETLSEVATVAVGSFILSILGIGTGRGTDVTSSPGLDPGSGSYITTQVQTISGPLGIQTVSEVATLASGLYISSIGGVNVPAETSITSTFNPGSASGLVSGPTSTNPEPGTFTGSSEKLDIRILPLFIVLWLVVMLLSS